MQDKNTPTTNETSPLLSLKTIALALSGLATVANTGCVKEISYPETTPVYADEIAPGVKPVDVEHHSVADPKVETVTPPSEPTTNEGGSNAPTTSSDAEAVSPVDSEQAASQTAPASTATVGVPTQGTAESTEASAEKPSPPVTSTKTKKPKKKAKKSAGAQGGCGVGTCG